MCKNISKKRRVFENWLKNNFELCSVAFIIYANVLGNFKNLKATYQIEWLFMGVLKNFTKFAGKHLCWSLFFNKVAVASNCFWGNMIRSRGHDTLKCKLVFLYFSSYLEKLIKLRNPTSYSKLTRFFNSFCLYFTSFLVLVKKCISVTA